MYCYRLYRYKYFKIKKASTKLYGGNSSTRLDGGKFLHLVWKQIPYLLTKKFLTLKAISPTCTTLLLILNYSSTISVNSIHN